ncbi:unnamed protein product [Leptidea sinapis]|uniref:Uncharacterized protein n=1 Tax=Leptidea sinapis TaxID=189913 RepID=A0A5E4PU39_9NEOP|nr:unnamed protein product [Leptidea sinapis]
MCGMKPVCKIVKPLLTTNYYDAHVRGFMNLKEMTNNWQQKGHVIANWNPSIENKPCDFVGKFLAGVD